MFTRCRASRDQATGAKLNWRQADIAKHTSASCNEKLPTSPIARPSDAWHPFCHIHQRFSVSAMLALALRSSKVRLRERMAPELLWRKRSGPGDGGGEGGA